MKQNNGSSKPVTKDELKIEMKNLRTDLRNTEKALRTELLRLEERMENFEGRMDTSDQNAIKYRDQILTKLDGVMGELAAMREENVVGTYQTSELKQQAENHEKRIARLEKTKQTS